MIGEHLTFIQGNKEILTEYEQSHFLGNGNNYVYEMIEKKTKEKLAVKLFDLKNEEIECFKNEVQLLEKIKNQPNKYIISYLGFCIAEKRKGPDPSTLPAGHSPTHYGPGQIIGYILMEKGKANLNKYIKKRIESNEGYFPQQVAIRFIQQMMEVHCHLQNIQIAHRDVKPDNIIITGEAEDTVDFKVCDVGAGTQSLNSTKTRTIIGTESFLSPELYQSFHSKQGPYLSYNPYVSDVFSLGLVFLYFLTFKRIDLATRQNMTQHQYWDRIRELQQIAVSNYPDLYFLQGFLKMMLEPDMTKRSDFLKVQQYLEANHFYSQFLYNDHKVQNESCLQISQQEGPGALKRIQEMSITDKQQILTLDIDLKNTQLNKSNILDDFGKSLKHMLNMKDFIVNLEINDLTNNDVKSIFQNLKELVKLQKLELQLWNNNIKDQGFSQLLEGGFNHPCLRTLVVNVSVNNISDQSLLTSCPYIQQHRLDNLQCFSLDFSLNKLCAQDSGKALSVLADLIQRMPLLQTLDLNFEGNKLKTHGTRNLLAVLPKLSNLLHLSLNFSFNESTDNGLYNLCDYLQTNPVLQTFKLVVPGNLLTDKLLKQLALGLEQLKSLQHLNLQLHHNTFSACSKHLHSLFTSLQCLPCLQALHLNLSHLPLSDPLIKVFSLTLQQITGLTSFRLVMDRVPVQNQSIKYISTAVSKLTSLTSLHFSFNSIQKIDTISLVFLALSLTNLYQLEYLSISMQGVQLQIEGFQQICSAFMQTEKLKSFHFNFQECSINGECAQILFSRLKYLSKLESFDICLKDNPIPDHDIQTIQQQLQHTYKDKEKFTVKF